ncbi:hypothetical protein N7493_011197 [Penicillium malachiteum]|uniref:Uncharacterized protein n=1 Tax=Penicillium malachiteum TaxID=1324776 RepID=A0AAD6MQX7_9EURO|nr:hypothetical protein N7493_011197 [Penicillium malachiteum]
MSSSWTPFYNGQPPIGFRNGRPFYNQVSPNAQRPPIPIKENLKNGSRGQILAGSAPESSPPSFETQRRQQGALEFPYGDRPPNFARAQTAPVENRSDFPRREPYLPGTQMNNEYRNYKNADSQAGQASTAYKNGVKQAKRNGRPSGTENKPSGKGVSLYSEGHRTVAPLAESASSKAQRLVFFKKSSGTINT